MADNKQSQPEGLYQVWHDRGWPESRLASMFDGAQSQFPRDYWHAANVQASSLQEAKELTTSTGHLLDYLANRGSYQSWDEKPGVECFTPKPFNPRDTDVGDVIVDPHGQAHRVERDGFKALTPAQASPQAPAIYDRTPESVKAMQRSAAKQQPEAGESKGKGK